VFVEVKEDGRPKKNLFRFWLRVCFLRAPPSLIGVSLHFVVLLRDRHGAAFERILRLARAPFFPSSPLRLPIFFEDASFFELLTSPPSLFKALGEVGTSAKGWVVL